MDIQDIIALLKDRVNDPYTQINDLKDIALSALEAVEDADKNLQRAIEEELEEEDPMISIDITFAVEDAVRKAGDNKNLEEIAEKLRDKE